MKKATSPESEILRTARFAADKHRDQRRKGVEASPYINHPIMVAEILTNIGGVTHLETIQAALLHDTIEDTGTTASELVEHFGDEVANLVMEVTDDKMLEKDERKRLQIEHAPHLSRRAKTIKLADKIANLSDLLVSPPIGWPFERQQQYAEWSNAVVAGCRGQNSALETYYDGIATQAIATLRIAV